MLKLFKLFTSHVVVRFIIAGGTSAVVDLGLLYVFNSRLGWHYLVSAVLAFIGAFGVSFTLHKFWTFQSHNERTDKQALLYLGTSLFGLSLNTMLMYLFVDYFHIQVLISQFFVGIMVAFSSFFISRNFVFKYKS
ncbi:GtrA family protein [Patescibacteria group bacterium]|nr:GtrA family protein [Patescibacteria group bacterium]